MAAILSRPLCVISLRADVCDMNLYLFQVGFLRMEVTPTVESSYLRWQWKTRTHLSNKILAADNLETSRFRGYAWWRHQMETISALLALCARTQRWSKHSWRRLFETPSRSLWRPCNGLGPSLPEIIWPRFRAQLHEYTFWIMYIPSTPLVFRVASILRTKYKNEANIRQHLNVRFLQSPVMLLQKLPNSTPDRKVMAVVTSI